MSATKFRLHFLRIVICGLFIYVLIISDYVFIHGFATRRTSGTGREGVLSERSIYIMHVQQRY